MFYGWKIVGVTFLTHFISIGFVFYSYGVFFNALEDDFGGSRLGVSAGLSFMNMATATFAPFLGRLLDQGSIRKLMSIGAVLLSLGFLLAARITALWQFYIILATFLGLGAAMLGAVASSTLVANWFVRRRGTALGIATMGVSLSGMVMAPVSTWMIREWGWRTSFNVYGLIAFVLVLPVVWRFVINRPEDIGLLPDGRAPGVPVSATDGSEGDPPAEPTIPFAPGDQLIDHPAHLEWSSLGAMRNPNFWIIVVVIGLNFCGNSAVLTHIIPHATDLGFSAERAALVLSSMAGVGVLGKFLFGWITDFVDQRVALAIGSALQAVGVWLIIGVEEYRILILAGAVFGFGMGGMVPLYGSMVGAAFGRRAFGRVMGLMSPFMLPLHMLGIPLAGHIFDRYGAYDSAFTIFVGLYVLSIGLVWFLALPETETGAEPLRAT